MSKQEHDEDSVFFIPPNFLAGGRLFGGMLRARNAAEAAALVLLTGIPVLRLPLSLTARAVLLCLVPLPLGILGAAGIEGGSLSEFAFSWLRWLAARRVLRRRGETPPEGAAGRRAGHRPERPHDSLGITVRETERKRRPGRAGTCTEDLVPVKDIRNGIIETEDGRYVKILEIEPINFLLRSPGEQRSIILNFAGWLKVAPVRVQIKVLTRKADISRHLDAILRDMEREPDPRCRALQEDYYRLIETIGSREAITRRFLLVMEYEAVTNRRTDYAEICAALETAASAARQYLLRCDNVTVRHDDEDAFLLDILYTVFNRASCERTAAAERVRDEQFRKLAGAGAGGELLPADVLAPDRADFTHSTYSVVDGVYYTCLMIPSDGYNPRVMAGWTSLLVNAGEGIDVDFFFRREPRERIRQKLGQQIRINRSRLRGASDTNADFDDYDSAIRAGYFLKQGLAGSEDFYYASVLVTVTADSLEDLEWRTSEVRRMMASQDMALQVCRFRQEDALRSVLPLCREDRKLFAGSRRNMLTSSVSACYPFTSFELSDENGILLGVNRHNNSLVIVDIFNSRIYRNANMAVLGTSGAGKTFTLQLMALRMRRRGTQVMILAPLKGHEFRRACSNVGGEFITISPGSGQCINILEIRKTDGTVNAILDGGAFESSALARKIQQVHIFFSLLIPDMNYEERQLLDEALVRAYAAKGITHDNASLADPDDPGRYREMPVLGDVYDILMASPETRRMGNILNRLVHGSAKTFNQQTNVDLTNPYTVLDISELTGDLLTVGMFVALDYMWDEAKRDRTREKAVIIDEAWQLIGAGSNTLAAEFVLEIFKVIRGYGGAAIAATQDISDFFALEGGKYGRGIINNAKTKIILSLEDDEARRVQEVLRLTDAEVMSIVRFERGNGLICTNSDHVAVEFRASELERQLITTDRYELSRLVEKKRGEMP